MHPLSHSLAGEFAKSAGAFYFSAYQLELTSLDRNVVEIFITHWGLLGYAFYSSILHFHPMCDILLEAIHLPFQLALVSLNIQIFFYLIDFLPSSSFGNFLSVVQKYPCLEDTDLHSLYVKTCGKKRLFIFSIIGTEFRNQFLRRKLSNILPFSPLLIRSSVIPLSKSLLFIIKCYINFD
ncbi:hypothetical protein CEXT_188351 [Caerostris extrusa]|uniref:Uncharacterized protein n=1 Tax=Caerostris extrusa TaxID=172846 RepID=A0AAV4TDQ6_CAEEX|nr:hypothetical protein CEXT_188351 [Caerostris extrusa]